MMTKEKYQTLSIKVLRDLAKTRGLKGIFALKKDELIERMLEADASDAEKAKEEEKERRRDEEKKAAEEWERWAAAKARAIDKREMRREEERRSEERREEEQRQETYQKEEGRREARKARAGKTETYTTGQKEDPTEKTAVEKPKRGRPRKNPSAEKEPGTRVRDVKAYGEVREKKTSLKSSAAPGREMPETEEKTSKAPSEDSQRLVKRPGRQLSVKKERFQAGLRNRDTADRQKADVGEAAGIKEASSDEKERPQGAEAQREEKTKGRKGRPAINRDSRTLASEKIRRRKPSDKAPGENTAAEEKQLDKLEKNTGEVSKDEPDTNTLPSADYSDEAKAAKASSQVASEEKNSSPGSTPAENARREYPTQSSPFHQDRLREARQVSGILEVMTDGYGFMRSGNFQPGEDDIYVSPSQIRRFGLKSGDKIQGQARSRGVNEKIGALLYVEKINDLPPEEARHRQPFEKMTPTFPDERVRLERADGSVATRIVDLISPIGKGQRGMIVSPPKAGKTTLLKDIAASILRRDPSAYLMILLIDERPEEVTDMKESVHGENVEILYSTFDEQPEHHKRVSEMAIERAKRLVEHRRDVFILLDSITRLARAYNVLVPPSGRTLSGGLDPTALYMPKRFFGAARNIREGGSLTILATALVDTGSKMDDVIYEEFKGTGNMELILDRRLQERRIFPAIDIVKSGTRREDLLLTPTELEAVNRMRRSMNGMKAEEAVEAILRSFTMTRSNDQVVNAVLSGRIG